MTQRHEFWRDGVLYMAVAPWAAREAGFEHWTRVPAHGVAALLDDPALSDFVVRLLPAAPVVLRAPVSGFASLRAQVDVGAVEELVANDETKDWIEVVIVDELDQPMANVAVVLTLPDGAVQRGHTNASGVLRYDGIASGACKFELPQFDASAWKQVEG